MARNPYEFLENEAQYLDSMSLGMEPDSDYDLEAARRLQRHPGAPRRYRRPRDSSGPEQPTRFAPGLPTGRTRGRASPGIRAFLVVFGCIALILVLVSALA